MKYIIEEELYDKIHTLLCNYEDLLSRIGGEYRNGLLEDDWNAFYGLVDKYDSLPTYEDESTEVKSTSIGHAAKVINEGLSYVTYADFFKENAIEEQYTLRYDYGYSASEDGSYVIVGEGYHDITNGKVYVLQNINTNRVYLVAEEGVKIL